MTVVGIPHRAGGPVVALGLVVLTAALLAVMLVFRHDDPAGAGAVVLGVGTTTVVGAAVAVRRPDHPCGWLLVGLTVLIAASAAGTDYVQSSVAAAVPHPGTLAIGWLTTWIATPTIALAAVLLLTFPTGRFPSRRWRIAAAVVGVAAAVQAVASAVLPGPLPIAPSLDNPLGIDGAGGILDVLGGLVGTVSATVMLAAVIRLIARYRRARGVERSQLRTLAAALPIAAAGIVAAMLAEGALNEASFYFAVVGLTAIPVAIAWAILRHGLFDIDVLVNRALVYGTLTVVVAGVYVALVAGLGRALQESAQLGVAVVATAVIAVAFAPLRDRLQQVVDRLMYGDRADPYEAPARLGRRLQDATAPGDALPLATETVGRSLKLGAVAVEPLGGGPAHVWGQPGAPADGNRLALIHGRELVGHLTVWPRPGEQLSPREDRLLADLCHPVAVVLHATVVERQLQASRQSLVTTRVEERRRLRADLHDGLGPELAGVVFGLGAARNTVRSDPDATDQLLADLQANLRQAVGHVRSLVEGLAPQVEQLGLAEALRQGTDRLATAAGLHLDLDLGALPALPPAVEIACYRIAMEALSNVTRHAEATRCTIRLATGPGEVLLTVCDDGRGLPEPVVPGVGLGSMRQRAEELGGTCTVDEAPGGGTAVRARLPLP